MKNIGSRFVANVIFCSFMLSSKVFGVSQLAPNDQRLAEDPTGYGSESQRVSDYIVMSGLDRLAKELDTDPEHISIVVDKAVDSMVGYGIKKLYDSGNSYQAAALQNEYNSKIKNWFQNHRDLFDHAPWSQFLVKFYGALESMLGHNACVMMHFDDLNEINYAITVVFDPKNPAYDINEYRKHMVPFCEGIAYWVSFLSCEIISYGAAISLVCTPIATTIEKVMTCCISPKISDRVYNRANGL